MNIWRMKLRAGPGGEDMFPQCKKRGIVSFTHTPILNTDLTKLAPRDVDAKVGGSARSSIFRFAWDIKGGDEIYIGDSKTQSMIAKGVVAGEIGMRAYRFNAGDAIREPSHPEIFWRHEVPVAWDEDFQNYSYKDPAPQHSVFRFKPQVKYMENQLSGVTQEVIEEDSEGLLREFAYQRETKASQKNIERLHVHLSNQFRVWLEKNFPAEAKKEVRGIDLVFACGLEKHIAEFKICYGEDTRHAIREALGQLFEYNHYPSYEEADTWWLVLDCEPTKPDRMFIETLRKKYGIPLTLAWRKGNEFKMFPYYPLQFHVVD